MPAKNAVLIGCNYPVGKLNNDISPRALPGTKAALRGCVNDVWGFKGILEEFYGFGSSDITVMIDTDQNYLKPTGKNIKAKISEMVSKAQDGDVCFLHFSGHGTQIPSQDGDEADSKDEAICPTDMNVICDDDLRVLLKPLESKPGVKFTFIADCCHSGTLLDHATVQINGPKARSAPLPMLNSGSLAGFLGVLGRPDDREWTNRALPFDDLCGQLSSLLGGAPVDASNVRSNVGSLYGEDASSKVQQFLQVFQQFNGGENTVTEKASGGGGGLLQLLCACFAAPPADQNGPSGQAANSANGPGASYVVASSGAPGEPNLPIHLPPAGAKPPAGEQLSEDVGVLITGCQANETSADACPSGDPTKAHGALSNAIQTVVRSHFQQHPDQPLTYRNLVIAVRELLAKAGFTQNPCLECSDRNADTTFIIH